MQIGTRIGAYEIIAKIGAGGMGEVYRARDSRIGRDVAIKVSAEQFNERSEREARAVASLNHPNVCTLHDVGPNYLVMELVEGDAAERARCRSRPRSTTRGRSPTPSRPRTRKASSIAISSRPTSRSALTAPSRCSTSAWRKSCRATSAEQSGSDLSHSPTMPIGDDTGGDDSRHRRVHGARAGARQARGQARRHLGVRRRPLRDADRPPRVRRRGCVVDPRGGDPVRAALGGCARERADDCCESCLEKDPKKRLRDIGDVWKLLDDQPASPDAIADRHRLAGSPQDCSRSWRRWRFGRRGARRRAPPCSRSLRLEVDLGSDVSLAPLAIPTFSSVVISPDGTRLVYVASVSGGPPELLTRRLDQPNATELAGTEGAMNPFFSPDGQWVGFWSGSAIFKVPVDGGGPVSLGDSAP